MQHDCGDDATDRPNLAVSRAQTLAYGRCGSCTRGWQRRVLVFGGPETHPGAERLFRALNDMISRPRTITLGLALIALSASGAMAQTQQLNWDNYCSVGPNPLCSSIGLS